MNPEEPSVLDYVKSRLLPWKGRPAASALPADAEPPSGVPEVRSPASPEPAPAEPVERLILPWRSLGALALALLAQWLLEPRPDPNRWIPASVLYAAAAFLLVWSFWRKEWQPAPLLERTQQTDPFSYHLWSFIFSIFAVLLAFWAFGGNRFSGGNVFLWATALLLALYALWLPESRHSLLERLQNLFTWLRRPTWQFHLSSFQLLWLAVFVLAVFFRFYHLAQVPPEMNSDHAEKLWDVVDVLNGQAGIFFPRNTGREPLQFYLIALTDRLFGTGISFLSMKIGTAIGGLLTLPFIYLLGKELANRRAGLLAMAFAGVAYWPNVLSRVALRFSLYPLFVAPALFFLLRGLRSGRRNDFILAGLSLGFGLLGYTPIRILPFVMVAAVALYLLHRLRQARRLQTLLGLAFVAFFAFIAALPLMRYAQENPESFSYRAFSRLTDLETSLPQPAGVIFLDNLKNAMLMYGWNDGQIWPVSIPGRPALDVVSAALFYLGMGLLLLRYLRQRNWEDLFLLLAVPMLMLPSILSLAYPAENPAPNRAGGALVPAFVIVGLCLDGWLDSLHRPSARRNGARLASLGAMVLFTLAAFQNYALTFRVYQEQYALSSWNTSELGQALADFAVTGGSLETAFVVKSAHWVDTRLVGMLAGDPTRDFGIDFENIPATAIDPRPKLFLVRHFARPEDRQEEEQVLTVLQQSYPRGWAQLYPSQYPGKDFWMFQVPPAVPGLQTPLYPEPVTP